jgi:hypothetical protein
MIDPHPALHAITPEGYRCADCSIDQEPCPACYSAWWRARNPNVSTPGATGRHPQGVLDAGDEGELTMAVAYDRLAGIVRLEFGTPVAWLGLPPPEAILLGESMIRNAKRA